MEVRPVIDEVICGSCGTLAGLGERKTGRQGGTEGPEKGMGPQAGVQHGTLPWLGPVPHSETWGKVPEREREHCILAGATSLESRLQAHILALPPAGSMTWHESFKFFKPQFPHLSEGYTHDCLAAFLGEEDASQSLQGLAESVNCVLV